MSVKIVCFRVEYLEIGWQCELQSKVIKIITPMQYRHIEIRNLEIVHKYASRTASSNS